MKIHGLQDVYGESGANDALLDKYGINVADIARAAKELIKSAKVPSGASSCVPSKRPDGLADADIHRPRLPLTSSRPAASRPTRTGYPGVYGIDRGVRLVYIRYVPDIYLSSHSLRSVLATFL